ncbi:hypothetical protein V5799_015241 [Amblyomma americanum]|uniref:Uncharacterized protein n=1 Tax=Amblyomma americanum TaxID=6943 RepID=A0AAQ4E0Q5_AMBAM
MDFVFAPLRIRLYDRNVDLTTAKVSGNFGDLRVPSHQYERAPWNRDRVSLLTVTHCFVAACRQRALLSSRRLCSRSENWQFHHAVAVKCIHLISWLALCGQVVAVSPCFMSADCARQLLCKAEKSRRNAFF